MASRNVKEFWNQNFKYSCFTISLQLGYILPSFIIYLVTNPYKILPNRCLSCSVGAMWRTSLTTSKSEELKNHNLKIEKNSLTPSAGLTPVYFLPQIIAMGPRTQRWLPCLTSLYFFSLIKYMELSLKCMRFITKPPPLSSGNDTKRRKKFTWGWSLSR